MLSEILDLTVALLRRKRRTSKKLMPQAAECIFASGGARLDRARRPRTSIVLFTKDNK